MALTDEQLMQRATKILGGAVPDLTDLDTADRAAVLAEVARLRESEPDTTAETPELLRTEVKPEPGI